MKEINEAYETITKQRSGGGALINVRPADIEHSWSLWQEG